MTTHVLFVADSADLARSYAKDIGFPPDGVVVRAFGEAVMGLRCSSIYVFWSPLNRPDQRIFDHLRMRLAPGGFLFENGVDGRG